jgi:hypothetical protein
VLAEKLAKKVKYPCKNSSGGCDQMLRLEVLEKHENFCAYGIYHCLVAKDNGCPWTGQRSDIVQHVRDNHVEDIFISDMCTIKYEEINFNQQRKFSRIISFSGEIFLFRSEFYPPERMLYEVVHYIGPEENASKYKYEHTLVSPSGDHELVFQNTVKCQSDVLENIHESEKCFVLHYKNFNLYLQDGTALEYTVKVFPTQS